MSARKQHGELSTGGLCPSALGMKSKCGCWQSALARAKASIHLAHGFRRRTRTQGTCADVTYEFCGHQGLVVLQSVR